uniref:RPT6A n=1 Tax=Arundo donax TaxID=35708 RepID=A0A0A8XN18_ARUDO
MPQLASAVSTWQWRLGCCRDVSFTSRASAGTCSSPYPSSSPSPLPSRNPPE